MTTPAEDGVIAWGAGEDCYPTNPCKGACLQGKWGMHG